MMGAKRVGYETAMRFTKGKHAFVDGERPGMIQSQYEADKRSAVKCVTGDCRIALRPFSGLGEEAL